MIQAAKGTKDILPAEITAWQKVEAEFARVCKAFNIKEIRVPTFEATELFQRGVGDSTDVVQKEMYSFEDKAGRSITLRPEITAGVVRAYLEHGLHNEPSPTKLYYRHTAFRYEKMGKGRYREFNQMGCEFLGTPGPASDAELISLLFMFFRRLGLDEISLKLNSIGCPKCRPAYLEKLRDFLRPHLDDLCPDCQSRFDRNPMRALDCKNERCSRIVATAPGPLDCLCQECQDHFDQLCKLLDGMGIRYEIDKHIVRGLDYYSKTVFEFVSDHVGSQGTICGGGRYDGLVEEVGGPTTPAVGFALGTERLLLELEAQGIDKGPEDGAELYILGFEPTREATESLAYKLREHDVRVETDLMSRSFRAQMKYANRIEAEYLLVLGDEEIASRQAKVKHMATGTEKQVDLSDIAGLVKEIKEC